MVTGSWGVCTGVPKRLEPHGWPARPFAFDLAGDSSLVTAWDPGLRPKAFVRDGGTRGTHWGRGAVSAWGTSACPRPVFPKLQTGLDPPSPFGHNPALPVAKALWKDLNPSCPS